MLEIKSFIVFMGCATFIECVMEPFIVGGAYAEIKDFPHSTFAYIRCFEGTNTKSFNWICGGSIVNQRIVLTAGHCLFGCNSQSNFTVSVGHRHLKKGVISTVSHFIIHPNYNNELTANDVALMRVRTDIKFGTNVKRVALMRNPPYYDERAQVAGWGMTNETAKTMGHYLKWVEQWVWKPAACRGVIRNAPKGTICASSKNLTSYASRGDSGSALVVRGYIQIGIVSYKMPTISKSLVIYTDTGYFYNWITIYGKKLYCLY